MKKYPFALYDAFSESAFGGSQAAVITDAATINQTQRQRIASELGMPATAFVDDHGPDWIELQFMSAVMELPMCGHGTICLLTHMLEAGLLKLPEPPGEIELRLPKSVTTVALSLNHAGRYRVMLDIMPPGFEPAPPRVEDLLSSLGLDATALSTALPIEIARGDFIHLLVPLTGLDSIRAIKTDFSAMVEFCHAQGIETIAVFCTEVENSDNQVHLRDFCPAVGVSESAAAGTTNAALSSYLLRHALLPAQTDVVTINAEQGIELGRTSSIQSRVTLSDNQITRLQVGGVATRVLDGHVYL